ncbi:YraN family protein [Corynebacterium timonense]|uniref:UPF0102 protein SAMN04488539_0641 n=1 Tax=Corynebacterium timonense TaxID=441500 RepID=A0A1H1MYV8_9CORY|nr:YraN family protein [Corynebacterium timonense]SDR91850.1 putative endonuclease [Corynebacterium timonense]
MAHSPQTATHQHKQNLGRAGEDYARRFYETHGYELIDARVRTAAGELDLIMRAPEGAIVVVEVKTRRGRAFGAAEAVTAKKLATMRRGAAEWLRGRPYTHVRFDVAEVLIADGAATIQIYEDVDHGSR